MSNVNIFKAGTPVTNYMWCEGDYPQYEPPFGNPPAQHEPPFTRHSCAAYNYGYFTLSMPICPAIMPWQRKAFTAAKFAMGDVIRCVIVQEDHYITAFNLKSVDEDKKMVGASVTPVAQIWAKSATGEYEWADLGDIEAAFTAAGYASIPWDTGSNVAVFLDKPLYVEPGTTVCIGLRIDALPTDTAIGFQDMQNSWYLATKIECFDSPTTL